MWARGVRAAVKTLRRCAQPWGAAGFAHEEQAGAAPSPTATNEDHDNAWSTHLVRTSTSPHDCTAIFGIKGFVGARRTRATPSPRHKILRARSSKSDLADLAALSYEQQPL